MRAYQHAGIVTVLLSLGGAEALAQQSDLVGTWTTETTVLLESEDKIVEAPREMSFVIEDVHGQFVRGYRTWKAKAEHQPGYVGDTALEEAREPFIGTVTSDGKSLRLVETEDEGMMFCERTGPDQIELTYMEAAPHPVVYTAVLNRAQ